MVVVKAVGRFLVATAAGAGVGAGAALYRKHLLNEDAQIEEGDAVWQETPPESVSVPEPVPAPTVTPAPAPVEAPAAQVAATPQDLACLLYTSPSPRD